MSSLFSKVKYKTYKFDKNKLMFGDVITTRYSMTCSMNCKKLYRFCHRYHLSFFNVTTAACLKALNSIKEYRTVLVGNTAREYEHLSAIVQLFDTRNRLINVFINDMNHFSNLRELDKHLNSIKIDSKDYIYEKKYLKDPKHPIAYLTCMPLVNFSTFRDIIWKSNVFMPCVHWGKYVNGKMTFVITANHIFVFGRELSLFFSTLQKLFDNPMKIYH